MDFSYLLFNQTVPTSSSVSKFYSKNKLYYVLKYSKSISMRMVNSIYSMVLLCLDFFVVFVPDLSQEMQ